MPERFAVPLAFAAAAVLFFGRLDVALLEPEEVRLAEIPRQMLAAGEWVVPSLHGQAFLDKPPLYFWLVMASYRAFGVADWSARLVPCLCAFLCVPLAWAWVRRAAGPSPALGAAVVLALAGEWVYRGRMLSMNGLLALCVLATLAAGHVALLGGRLHRGWWLVAGVTCGLGVLAKGPLALALAVPPVFAAGWLDRSLARPGVAAWLAFGAAAAAVAGPWFAAVAAREPDFVGYFFLFHNVRRFTDPFDHAEPFWFYLPSVLGGFLPWTLLLFRRDRLPEVGRFALLAAGWGLVFFSLSGCKRAGYVLPVLPLFAVGLGCRLPTLGTRYSALGRRAGLVTFAVLFAGVYFWLPAYNERFSLRGEVAAAAPESERLAVFSYPRRWDSVSYYLRRPDVRAFTPQLHEEFRRELVAAGGGLVFVKTPALGELVRQLPVGMRFVPLRADGWVTSGRVVRE